MPSTDELQAMKARAFDLQRDLAIRQQILQQLVQEIAAAEQEPPPPDPDT